MFEYELLYSGEGCDGKPFVMGLMDPACFGYDGNKEHPKPQKEHPSSPQGGAKEHAGSNGKNAETPALVRRFEHLPSEDAKTHVSNSNGKSSSYPQHPSSAPLSTALPPASSMPGQALAASPTFAHGD